MAKNRGRRDDDAEPNENEAFSEELDDEVDGDLVDEDDADDFDDDSDSDADAELDPDKETVPPGDRARRRGRPGARKAAGRARPKEERRATLLTHPAVYVREVVAELQKVIRPTRRELLTYTTVVVVFVAIMMTFVSLLDVGFAKLLFVVFGGNTTTQ